MATGGVQLSIKWAPGDEKKFLSLLDPKRYKWAMKESLNRTAGNVATFGVKKVAKEMGIPEGNLKKRGRFAVGSGKKFGAVSKGRGATARRLAAEVKGYGKPFNAVRWNGAALGDGKRGVKHEAWGRPQVNLKAWQLTNKPGKPLVIRKGKSFRGLYGPGVTNVMQKPEIEQSMQKFANRRFRGHWRSRLAFAFNTDQLPSGRR